MVLNSRCLLKGRAPLPKKPQVAIFAKCKKMKRVKKVQDLENHLNQLTVQNGQLVIDILPLGAKYIYTTSDNASLQESQQVNCPSYRLTQKTSCDLSTKLCSLPGLLTKPEVPLCNVPLYLQCAARLDYCPMPKIHGHHNVVLATQFLQKLNPAANI